MTVHEVAWWVRSPEGWRIRGAVRDGFPRRIVDGVEGLPRSADSAALASARARLARGP